MSERLSSPTIELAKPRAGILPEIRAVLNNVKRSAGCLLKPRNALLAVALASLLGSCVLNRRGTGTGEEPAGTGGIGGQGGEVVGGGQGGIGGQGGSGGEAVGGGGMGGTGGEGGQPPVSDFTITNLNYYGMSGPDGACEYVVLDSMGNILSASINGAGQVFCYIPPVLEVNSGNRVLFFLPANPLDLNDPSTPNENTTLSFDLHDKFGVQRCPTEMRYICSGAGTFNPTPESIAADAQASFQPVPLTCVQTTPNLIFTFPLNPPCTNGSIGFFTVPQL